MLFLDTPSTICVNEEEWIDYYFKNCHQSDCVKAILQSVYLKNEKYKKRVETMHQSLNLVTIS